MQTQWLFHDLLVSDQFVGLHGMDDGDQFLEAPEVIPTVKLKSPKNWQSGKVSFPVAFQRLIEEHEPWQMFGVNTVRL